MNLFFESTLYKQNKTQNKPQITVYILNSIYICNNIIIFINFIQIIWDISNTKTIKYENIIIFSR